MTCVPCLIKVNLTEQECYTLALRSNSATETVVPTTLVTSAEFIWQRLKEHYKQQAIADMLGWSRDKVTKYAALREICEPAWKVIVTTFENSVTTAEEAAVTSDGTPVAFTKYLLRDLIPLKPEQQGELVQLLASRTIRTMGAIHSYYQKW